MTTGMTMLHLCSGSSYCCRSLRTPCWADVQVLPSDSRAQWWCAASLQVTSTGQSLYQALQQKCVDEATTRL